MTRRGAVVVVRQRGVYEGKPRPAIVIQADAFLAHHPSVLVCLVADEEENASGGAFYRISVAPTSSNGLAKPSVIMADRVTPIRRDNIGRSVGDLDAATPGKLDLALALFQGLA